MQVNFQTGSGEQNTMNIVKIALHKQRKHVKFCKLIAADNCNSLAIAF